LIGTDDGTIVIFDQTKLNEDGKPGAYVDIGMRQQVMYNDFGAIGTMSIKNNSIVIGNSNGLVVQYPICGSEVQP
jgi:hypothetical protein